MNAPQVIAHRGSSARYPDNTPSALRRIVDAHCALSGVEPSRVTRATAGELVESTQSARQEES